MPRFPASVEKLFSTNGEAVLSFFHLEGHNFAGVLSAVQSGLRWATGTVVWSYRKLIKLEFEILKKKYKRPGRDVRSVFSNRISNPGRRSDSPPY